MLKITLSCLIALVTTHNLLADPIAPEKGKYHLKDSLNLVGQKIVETVHLSKKQRVKELQSKGYTCKPPQAQTFICSKWVNTTKLPSKIENQVLDELSRIEKISVINKATKVELESEADHLSVWEIEQNVCLGDDCVKKYKLYQTRDMDKFKFETKSGVLWLNRTELESFQIMIQKYRSLTANRWIEFLIEGSWVLQN